jgi:hypothetical protein
MNAASFASNLTSVYDRWVRPSYEIRVQGTMYLWGSAGITTNLSFAKPLVLHIRNDLFGEEISFGTQNAAKTQTPYGTLQPGECASIQLQDVTGVFAICATASIVACIVNES